MRHSPVQQAAYILFVGSIAYVGGTLPCGRFYYEAVEGFFGNVFLKLSYQYIFLYMGLIVHLLDLAERGFLATPYLLTYCAGRGVFRGLLCDADSWVDIVAAFF